MFGIMRKIGSIFTAGRSSGTPKPDAKELAMYILYNVTINSAECFGIRPHAIASISNALPESVRGTFGAWGKLYVAWMLLQRAAERYGDSFRADATALVPASLDSAIGIAEGTEVIIGYFRKIFDMMDTTRREGEFIDVNGYNLPIVARIASGLIVLEGDMAPEKLNSAIELALALEQLNELASPQFDHALALTAEKGVR